MAEEVEKSFPFDSDEINGEYDREYAAEDFARYFRTFISSGTFMQPSDNLQVVANGDMTVTLKKGAMMIDGYRYDAEGDIVIGLDPADGVLNRIDRISATWSKEDRDVHYTLRKGTESYEPAPPECRRTSDFRDYVVADVYVKAGTISIKQSDITDQRLNSEVCGLAMPFMSIDTKLIFDQLQAFYKETVENNAEWEETKKARFDKWFEMMKDQLSEDAAGFLMANKLGITDDSKENTVTFESRDTQNPDSYENIDLLTSGETHKSLWNKMSIAVKNMRFLHKRMGGFSFYPNELTQAEYNALPAETKSTPKLLFVVRKG